MKTNAILILVTAASLLITPPLWAARFGLSYLPEVKKCLNSKALFDDSRPDYVVHDMRKEFPEDVLNKVLIDVDESKKAWQELIGYKAPDVVGEIAPEIKPGKYTLADKEKYPFDKLMHPYWYNKWNEPEKHIGNFSEFTVIPTLQCFFPAPVAKATLENEGKAKIDDQGYILEDTYVGGIPFHRPSEPHTAWKLMWNYYYYSFGGAWDNMYLPVITVGINSRFKQDGHNTDAVAMMKLCGRIMFDPIGQWYDKQAEKNKELYVNMLEAVAPRQFFGDLILTIGYRPPQKDNLLLYYYSGIRRIRKLAPSDGQDQYANTDYAIDDTAGFSQKLNPKIYPYEIRIIAETELLVPDLTLDGTEYLSSKEKYVWKGLKMQRRPVWIVEMKQLDSNYIYSKRIMYFDRESFTLMLVENYDQKGRLWRTYSMIYGFLEEYGQMFQSAVIALDHIDTHSTFQKWWMMPCPGIDREEVSVRRLMHGVK